MMKIWEEIMNLVYPDGIYCIGCGAIIDGKRPYNLCNKCLEHFHFANGRTCVKCGRVLSDGYERLLCNSCIDAASPLVDIESGEIDGDEFFDGHVFDRGFTCMMYGLYEKEMVKAFKYHGKAYYARTFGEMMYDRITSALPERNIDIVVPVPLHKKKLRRRGYNQAELLAAETAKRMKRPMINALVRTVYTAPMSKLTGAERGMNLIVDGERSVFEVLPAKRSALNGKCILLIDDIYTTGATADACAAELKRYGAKEVIVLTLASAGNPPPMDYDML